jgi:uncharacterized membrane protein (DUF485 family)
VKATRFVLLALVCTAAGLLVFAIMFAKDVVSSPPTLTPCEATAVAGAEGSALCLNAYDNRIRQYRSEYDKWSLNHRARVLGWQHVSGVISFFVVMAIILAGVYMSYLEFTKNRDAVTTLKFGQTGVELSSPVIGVIVLLISFLFTTVYLEKVYPVREIPQAGRAVGGS